MAKVTWEQYRSFHHIVSEEEFEEVERLAEHEVARVIGPLRWDNISADTFGYAQLQECICQVIDYMVAAQRSAVGKGVASVSNDGYSESYVVQTVSQLREELTGLIRAWLSGTGLVGAY